MKPRTAGRVLLLQGDGRVLLVRFVFPQTGESLHFWAAPGGGVEGIETPLQAAHRELREELGIALELTGPVHESIGIFEYEGDLVQNRDVFFTGRWYGPTPQLLGATALERGAMRELRWWSIEELRATAETVYPRGLADLLPTLQAADQ